MTFAGSAFTNRPVSRNLPGNDWGSAPFRAIYEAEFEFVWRTLRRLGVREPDVLDITQRVFLTAYRRLPEFQGASPLRSWLFGICRRAASDYRRSAVVRREVIVEASELEMQPDERASPLSGAVSRDQIEVAEAVMSRLPEYQRLVFLLFELEEMSGDDIAALLNVSVGTVRSRLRLARKAFRRELKRLAIAEGEPWKEAV
jgi:RNA polymerase sigma-70 factor (ECF subfamily)